MKIKVIQILASYRTTLFLLATYALLMAAATIIEKQYGTPVAKGIVYYSPLFFLIQILLCAAFVCTSMRRSLFTADKWHYSLLHGAFIVILAGAGVTHLWGREGIIHLREGEKTRLFRLKGSEAHAELPFELELRKFNLIRYPGSLSPSSYESYLTIHTPEGAHEVKICMNHIQDMDGYRLFQASYDEDERGSILSVSDDSTGRSITYIGYLLLFIGLAGSIFAPKSRLMSARRRLNKLTGTILPAVILCFGSSLDCHAGNMPQDHLREFGRLPMQSVSGRIIPINTFAEELLQKTGMQDQLSIPAEQWLLEMMTFAPKWANIPIVAVENKSIRHKYGWEKERISYRDAFTGEGKYLLADEIAAIYHKSPEKRNQLDKDLIKLDERINIIHQLFNFQLLRIFPLPDGMSNNHWAAAGDDLGMIAKEAAAQIGQMVADYRQAVRNASESGSWEEADRALQTISRYQKTHAAHLINDLKLKAEVSYNRYNLSNSCKKIYLISGGLLLLLTFYFWFRPENRAGKKGRNVLIACVACGFLAHSYTIILRWYISGYAPWSNSYETMVTMAWVAVAGGLLFARRDSMTCALATLFGGIALFVSELNWMDPQITPLAPVLKSPWLMFHVATLMAAYGFFGICCFIGGVNLLLSGCSKRYEKIAMQIKRLTLINEILMIIGMALMGIGIFLGAVWANESWGRYWGWDPKETWALISFVLYALVLHAHWFYPTADHKRFNLLAQLSFLSVLMTYFGVNYLLSGMHSYGNTSGLTDVSMAIWLPAILFFTIPAVTAYTRISRK